jgi:hypothetical protein
MSKTLGLTMQHQEQTNWCWAAVATSISVLLDHPSPWTQCTLANAQLNRGDCCTNGSDPATCNQVAHLETSLTLIQHRNPDPNNPFNRMATPDEIRTEIDARRPIGVRIGWDNSLDQGHFIVVTGYDETAPQFALWISDPEVKPSGSPPIKFNYAALQQGYKSSGKWTHTYFTV